MPFTETRGSSIGLYVPVGDPATPTLVAARRDLELSESMDTREVTTTQSGQWKKFSPGAHEWSVSLTHVLLMDKQTGDFESSQDLLRTAKREENIIQVKVRYPGGSQDEGDGLITDVTTTADYDSLATVDVSVQGTGPIVRTSV